MALTGGGADAGLLGDAAASVVTAPGDRADVVLALDPMPPQAVVAAAPELAQALRGGGVLVMVSRPDGTPDGGRSAIEAALAGRFRHIATFCQCAVVGTLLADARRAGSRVVALADDPTPASAMAVRGGALVARSRWRCVRGAVRGDGQGLVANMRRAVRPVAVGGRPVRASVNPVELPEEVPGDEDRARAVPQRGVAGGAPGRA